MFKFRYLLLLLPTLAAAQPSPLFHAIRVDHAPRIDGTLSDPAWQQATPISGFREREPQDGIPATERTEVRVLYDAHHVYFGISCFDSHPQGIIASQLRRDLDMSLDDNFSIIVDPSNTRRNGYIFQINPLGTQLDGLVIEEQAPRDPYDVVEPSWDGLWTSAATINDQGWTATVSIPFSTLNFKSTRSDTWGINFRRFIRRKNEEDLWSGYRRRGGIWRVSESGSLHGMKDIGSGRLLIVKPYILGGFTQLKGQPNTFQHTAGFDVKYGIRSNLIANLTVNTDFADADVDQQQFNLTPYRLYFPEKRRFFLENSDVFEFLTWNTDLLFFSRQIGIDANTGAEVPIDVGGKVAGQVGGFDIGLMDVKTRSFDGISSASYTVTRVKRPLFGNSYIGAMFVDKESQNQLDPYNRAFGVDAKFVFFKDLNIRGFYAKTWSPLFHGDDYTAGIRAIYNSRLIHIYAGQGAIRPNYNPEVGFVARPDDNPLIAEFTFTPRPKIRGVRELQFDSFLGRDPDSHWQLQSREIFENVRVLFNNGALSDNFLFDHFYQRLNAPFNIYKNIDIPEGEYNFTRHQVSFSSAGDRRVILTGTERWGGYYTGTLNETIFNAQYRPGSHLAMGLTNTLNSFRLPQGDFNVLLAGLQVSYAFNRFVNLTTFLQGNTADDQAMSANVRLRYTFRPDSDLFVIYNLGSRFQSLNGQNLASLRESRFAVKMSYSWSR